MNHWREREIQKERERERESRRRKKSLFFSWDLSVLIAMITRGKKEEKGGPRQEKTPLSV